MPQSFPMSRLCVRARDLFADRRFERLAAISNGHLYNLRRSITSDHETFLQARFRIGNDCRPLW